MSKAEIKRPTVSLTPGVEEDIVSPTHNILRLETHIDPETNTPYTLFVQPYPEWNQYGVLDPTNPSRSILEVYSMIDSDSEAPVVQAWWQSNITPEEYLTAVNSFFDCMEEVTGEISQGRMVVSGPTQQLRGMDVVHTSHFNLDRPFDIKEAQDEQIKHYELETKDTQQRYGWPFSFEQTTFIGLYTPKIGEMLYDRLSGVIGFSALNNIYKKQEEEFTDGIEEYCINTKATFPLGLFSKVMSHVLEDPYQQR